MIKRLTLLVFTLMSGMMTISLLPSTNLEEIPFFVSELIINPFRSFVGMVGFFMTSIAFSVFVRSIIEQILHWLKGVHRFHFSQVIDYSSFLCILYLFGKSTIITMLFFVISLSLGIVMTNMGSEVSNEWDEGDY